MREQLWVTVSLTSSAPTAIRSVSAVSVSPFPLNAVVAASTARRAVCTPRRFALSMFRASMDTSVTVTLMNVAAFLSSCQVLHARCPAPFFLVLSPSSSPPPVSLPVSPSTLLGLVAPEDTGRSVTRRPATSTGTFRFIMPPPDDLERLGSRTGSSSSNGSPPPSTPAPPPVPASDVLDAWGPVGDPRDARSGLVTEVDVALLEDTVELCLASDRDRAMNAPAEVECLGEESPSRTAVSAPSAPPFAVSSSIWSRSRTPRALLPTNSKSHASSVSRRPVYRRSPTTTRSMGPSKNSTRRSLMWKNPTAPTVMSTPFSFDRRTWCVVSACGIRLSGFTGRGLKRVWVLRRLEKRKSWFGLRRWE